MWCPAVAAEHRQLQNKPKGTTKGRFSMLGPTRPTGRTRSNLRLASRHLLCCLRKSGSLHSVPTSIPHPAMDDATATAFFLLPIPSEGSNSKQDKALWPLRILCFKVGFPFPVVRPSTCDTTAILCNITHCTVLALSLSLRCINPPFLLPLLLSFALDQHKDVQ